MNEPVLAIEADELLEWLRTLREQARNNRDEATNESMMNFYDGAVRALWKATRYVEHKAFLMSKEREISIQEKLEGEKND